MIGTRHSLYKLLVVVVLILLPLASYASEVRQRLRVGASAGMGLMNKNQNNPFLRKILLEYFTLLVVILHVCKHTASLTPNIVVPY